MLPLTPFYPSLQFLMTVRFLQLSVSVSLSHAIAVYMRATLLPDPALHCTLSLSAMYEEPCKMLLTLVAVVSCCSSPYYALPGFPVPGGSTSLTANLWNLAHLSVTMHVTGCVLKVMLYR